MQPTRERNLSSIYFNHDSEHILFDCGEGTQRQMKIAGLKPTKLTKIIISHFHADHVLGLGGLMRYLDANGYEEELQIYGPKGLNAFFNNIMHSAYFGQGVKVKLTEIKPGKIVDEERFTIESFPLKHSVPSFGFVIKEKDKRKINIEYTSKFGLKQHPILGELQKGKTIIWEGKKITPQKATTIVQGKKVGIIWDTGICDNCIKIAKDAEVIISESTFSINEKNKAKEYKHLTTEDAAKIAKKGKAKKLVLTHFSQRYKDTEELLREAKKVFSNTTCAHDFLEINI